ncbi:hypothetical protein FRC12_017022 [Ceratobasidium sp. 428]|nr:hypothetical protein FRC12_017022 [Ceratobasidium sp. 428]
MLRPRSARVCVSCALGSRRRIEIGLYRSRVGRWEPAPLHHRPRTGKSLYIRCSGPTDHAIPPRPHIVFSSAYAHIILLHHHFVRTPTIDDGLARRLPRHGCILPPYDSWYHYSRWLSIVAPSETNVY